MLRTQEYQLWLKNPENRAKPIPAKFVSVAPKPGPQAQLTQGGYLGSSEYKFQKANYDTYGKHLPGVSDFDDFLGFAQVVSEGKVDDAVIFAVGFVIPEVSGKMIKGPLHHIFTNNNFKRGQQWSKKFMPLFEKEGYDLDDAINKINVIGHKGPHPDEYHEAIYKRL